MGLLGMFHLIGGVALGIPLRQWLRGRFSCNSIFFVVWGAMFGVLPLVIGFNVFVPHGATDEFNLELALLLVPILIVVLLPDRFLASFDARAILPVAIGGVFLLVGLGVGAALYSSSPLTALIIGGVFGGLGGMVLIAGVVSALRR